MTRRKGARETLRCSSCALAVMRESKAWSALFPCPRERSFWDNCSVQLIIAADGWTCERLPMVLQYDERSSSGEQEHSAQWHSAPLGRQPVLSCVFACWMGCTAVVGADAELTIINSKTMFNQRRQHYYSYYATAAVHAFFPTCARIHSEAYRGITPALLVTT